MLFALMQAWYNKKYQFKIFDLYNWGATSNRERFREWNGKNIDKKTPYKPGSDKNCGGSFCNHSIGRLWDRERRKNSRGNLKWLPNTHYSDNQ